MALYGAETWTLRAADQKYLESFEMWCWRRMEKICWTDHVKNEVVLLRVNKQRNILQEIRKGKANWIGHILRRNCLLKQVIEGNIKGEMEVARRRGRRCKKLLDDLKERRGYSHLKEEALNRTMWRHCFGEGIGLVVSQITEWWWLQTSLFCELLMFLVGHPVPHTYQLWIMCQARFLKDVFLQSWSLLENIIVLEKPWASTIRVKNLSFQSNVITPQFSLSNFKRFVFRNLFHRLFICQKGMFQMQR